MKLTQEIVKELLDYDPDTGKLTWRPRGRHWFNSENSCNAWNGRFANEEAFTSINHDGYKAGSILNKGYLAQRIIYLWMTGETPVEIDHDDRDKTNNRWDNLSNVSRTINTQNMPLRKDSSTGYVGVTEKSNGKFSARVQCNNTRVFLGYFDTAEEAHYICLAKRKELGFHENHGRKAI